MSCLVVATRGKGAALNAEMRTAGHRNNTPPHVIIIDSTKSFYVIICKDSVHPYTNTSSLFIAFPDNTILSTFCTTGEFSYTIIPSEYFTKCKALGVISYNNTSHCEQGKNEHIKQIIKPEHVKKRQTGSYDSVTLYGFHVKPVSLCML